MLYNVVYKPSITKPIKLKKKFNEKKKLSTYTKKKNFKHY